MKLEQAQELYSDYKEGTLSPAMMLALEQHFEADPASKRDYDDFARVFDLLAAAEAKEVEVPHGFRAKIMDRAAGESAKRQTAPTGPLDALRDLFRQPRRLQTALVLGAVAGVVVISAVFVGTSHKPAAIQSNVGIAPVVPIQTTVDPSQSIVSSVSSLTDAASGAVTHDFVLRLPKGLKSGIVDGYVVSSTGEISDPAIRERQATHIAKAEPLAQDQDLTIPVEVGATAATGSTLNVVFDIHTAALDGQQTNKEVVVFTPMMPSDTVSMTSAPPANGKFFDSLQTVASEYHVTVIADAAGAPDTAGAWMANDSVDEALARVVGVGNSVKQVDGDTYFVYQKQQ